MTSTTSAKLWFIKVVDGMVKVHSNMEPLAKKDGQLYGNDVKVSAEYYVPCERTLVKVSFIFRFGNFYQCLINNMTRSIV